METPLFHTHHAPVGAWASLTFGVPGVGVSIDLQDPCVKSSGALLVGVAGEAGIKTIAFADVPRPVQTELTAEGDKEHAKPAAEGPFKDFGLFEPEQISRTLTPSVDAFSAEEVSFSVYTPYDALPDPLQTQIPSLACVPGFVMDVTVDNRAKDTPVTAFFGLRYADMKRVTAQQTEGMCTIRYRDDWMFAAKEQDGVFLARGLDTPKLLRNGTAFVHQNGPAFLCLRVPAGEKRR